LSNLTVFNRTSPFHLYLGFPVGLLLRNVFPSIHSGILSVAYSYYMPSPI
jgi:hypothetical protein